MSKYIKDLIRDYRKMAYKSFLDKNKNINVLLDVANIMFFIDRKITINGYHRLNTIYNYMKKKKFYPLIILHQRHYDYLDKTGLNKEEIKEIKELYETWTENNDLYLTPHKMNDDWFFLYGSVYRKKCMVVTNDHLRDHIFKISKKDTYDDILKKWIDRRIIKYDFNYNDYKNLNSLKLKFPSKYSKRIQNINSNWYFPISNNKQWLIVKLN